MGRSIDMATEYLDKAGATLLVQKTKAELAKKVDAVAGKYFQQMITLQQKKTN